MKILYRYIVRAFLKPWIVTFLVCVFLLLMQFLWRYIDDLVGKGLEFSIIMELVFYASQTLVPMALPLSVLLATIMTYGNFGETNELFAMRSGGISLYRLMLPLLVFNIAVAFGAFYFQNNFLPYTNLKMRSLLYSIQQQRPEVNIQNGIFAEPVDNMSLKVDHKNKKDNTLENVLLYDHRDMAGNTNVTIAKSGNIKISQDKSLMILTLLNGRRYEELKLTANAETYPHQSSKFDKQVAYINIDDFKLERDNEDLFKGGYQMMNNAQLSMSVDSMLGVSNARGREIEATFKTHSLFKGKNEYVRPDAAPVDTAAVDPATILPVDTLYSRLSASQKDNVIESALNLARSAKNYVDVTAREMDSYKKYISRYNIEWHRKFVLSFACVLFFIIGAPLGAIIRKGGFGVPVIVSVFIFLIYYVVSITLEKTVREMVITPFWGMWLSTIVLLPVGIFLTIRSASDSMRLNPRIFVKIQNFFKKKARKHAEGR